MVQDHYKLDPFFPVDSHAHGSHCCPSEGSAKRPWYRNLLVLSLLSSSILMAFSFFVSPLQAFRHAFIDYWRIIWWAILLGFVLGGVIDYYIPREYISKHLAPAKRRTVFYSVGLGLLMSACSHGILAIAIELHKKGASGPAVVSFLLASPWANLPVTLLLIGFFGWRGLLIILAALIVAVISGFIFQSLDQKGWIERNRHIAEVEPDFSITKDIRNRFRAYHFSLNQLGQDAKGIAKGAYELTKMVLAWVLIGMVLASLAAAFVPEPIFNQYLGPTLPGLLLTMLAATVLEVCSEGTAPLAFELYRQTGAFGNSFAFLMGGVVTDYTEIGLLWTHLGRRTALWMIAISVPQVVLIGFLLNAFLK